MTKAVAKAKSKLPAHLQAAADAEMFDEFTQGAGGGFPVLSYRGKVWRWKEGGAEVQYLDENDDAVQSIPVVLLRSNPNPSKVYYEKKYEEGDDSPPLCYSSDGIRPDPGVEEKQNDLCKTCPKNAWGSRITDEGKKSRACSDVRRMAIALGVHMEEYAAGDRPKDEVAVALLRVPPASLNPLKEYVATKLKPKGVFPHMLITRVGFDNEASYPKMIFRPARFLDADEFELSEELRESDKAKEILFQMNEVTEHAGGETTEAGEAADGADHASDAEAASSASPSSPKKKKMQAVDEEELNFPDEDEEEEAPKKRAAKVEEETFDEEDEDEGDEEEEAPPPPPKKKVKKKTKKKAAKKKAASKPPEDDESDDDDDFDDMLASILED